MRTVTACFFMLAMAWPVLADAPASQDRLYGRVITQDGDVHEGFIRWDKNEASWVDILDGSKRLKRTARQRSFKFFGLEVNWEQDGGSTSRLSGIRFGHLKTLKNTGSDKALLTLRSGQEVELRGGSTDIGTSIRSILVEAGGEQVELRWRDIDRVEFMEVPRGARAEGSGERLYGTLTTRSGLRFTGYICWDVDEVLTTDILDGEDERNRDHEIAFGEIAEISRESPRSARVRLKKGDTIVLHGSNDVNSANRDILVLDPSLGQVRVPWKAFDTVVFEPSSYTHSYSRFYTSSPLVGTVETRDGDVFSGTIRWDDDEAYTWELLNGERDDLDFRIELGLIRHIERVSSSTSRVTLFDGRDFELRGSNDVNDGNSGIYIVLDNSEEVLIDWDLFARATFEKP